MAKLDQREWTLLREVVWRRGSRLLPVAERVGRAPLTDDEREELRGLLADELCDSGLGADGEPNSRGIDLDRLIGRLAEF